MSDCNRTASETSRGCQLWPQDAALADHLLQFLYWKKAVYEVTLYLQLSRLGSRAASGPWRTLFPVESA